MFGVSCTLCVVIWSLIKIWVELNCFLHITCLISQNKNLLVDLLCFWRKSDQNGWLDLTHYHLIGIKNSKHHNILSTTFLLTDPLPGTSLHYILKSSPTSSQRYAKPMISHMCCPFLSTVTLLTTATFWDSLWRHLWTHTPYHPNLN